ncbi:CpsB/CapC family capsule biosynthesis tyrosine phosphatase [Paenibacillus sp. PL2-23]|uniref:tyrosine-protein phosphatase n=1 Tax=Paenibacillus sp. PL2-23 TaxID=2100729 RepID=UPI0030F844E9
MIDIHTHILPGIDDGSAHDDEALALARAAAADGIRTLMATPHHANGRYLNPASDVRRLVEEMNRKLELAGIEVAVAAGQEIRVHDDLLDAWRREELLTLAGSRYILLEMPSSSIPQGMEELMHELAVLGLVPVIAHPERNAEVVQHPERLAELVELGAIGQVTTHSLLGGFGKRIEQSAWKLLRQGSIHIVSSDAHHPDRRGFRLSEAYASIEQSMGAEWSGYLKGNAEAILANRALGAMPSLPVPGGGVLRKLFSGLLRK